MAIKANMRSIKNARVWRNLLSREVRKAGQGRSDETAGLGVKEQMWILKMGVLLR